MGELGKDWLSAYPGCSAHNLLCGPKPQRAFLAWHHPYSRKDGDICMEMCVEMPDGHGGRGVSPAPLYARIHVYVWKWGVDVPPSVPLFFFFFVCLIP
jgi:hypothetical protein